MLNLLATSTEIDITSVVVSSVLSFTMIVVTIVSIIINYRTTKYFSFLPVKTEITNSILKCQDGFYDSCTKLILDCRRYVYDDINDDVTKREIYDLTTNRVLECLKLLDDLNTNLDEVELKVESIFPKNAEFISNLKGVYNSSEDLYIKMRDSEDLINGLIVAWGNERANNIDFTYLYKDLLCEDKKYETFIEGISDSTKLFLDSYKETQKQWDALNLQAFIKF